METARKIYAGWIKGPSRAFFIGKIGVLQFAYIYVPSFVALHSTHLYMYIQQWVLAEQLVVQHVLKE